MQPSQWLILVLALFLVITTGAVLWVSTSNATSTSLIRREVEKELLISDMTSAVQVEAELAGAFVGNTSDMLAMEGGDSMESMTDGSETSGVPTDGAPSDMTEGDMSEMGSPEPDPGALLTDDPELLGAIGVFEEAAGSLKQLMSDSEQGSLEAAITAHDDFMASMTALDAEVIDRQDAMSFYHGNTQVFEAELRASLRNLQMSSSTRLQSSVDEVSSTEILLRWAVPLLLLAGLVVTASLLRMQANKRRIATLEHLVEVKGEFIAAVSHELRTPLTAVVGFADLLRKSGADLTSSDRAEMTAAIAEQSGEVAAIVEDLLVAARTDIGKLNVATVSVNLRAQTAQVLEILDQSQSIAILGHPPAASGDPARVRQILRNLFTNAVRYGGDHISVELGSQSDGLASLIVKDDGDPIPKEDRERIFEPYEQAHDQPRQPGSIGLGLSVSRRLARLMGGDLTYRHDGHSIFELSLPLAVHTDLESQQPAAAAALDAVRSNA